MPTSEPPDRGALVLQWAASCGRDLPWRHTRDPWAVLVSEVMCQQTQVARVIPYWEQFIARWPTPAKCASEPRSEVLRAWEGLGFPRRAKHLHATAGMLADLPSFPDTLDGLLALPGVGAYTARAVLAFAFNRDVGVVDTNTARVLARWTGRSLGGREVQHAADSAVPIGSGWAWNQAMLDLGALVCTKSDPHCDRCPVRAECTFGVRRLNGDGDRCAQVDPAIGTAGVSVPQSRFAGSDRQLRGALMRAAAKSAAVHDLVSLAPDGADLERVTSLIDVLIDEGLVQRWNDPQNVARIVLPGAVD